MKFIKWQLLFFKKLVKKKLAIFSNNFQTPLTITLHSYSPDCLGKFFLSFFLHNLKIIKTLTKLRILPFSQTTFTDKCTTVLLNSPARHSSSPKRSKSYVCFRICCSCCCLRLRLGFLVGLSMVLFYFSAVE